jgi:2-oxoisovalerate dehydrogenase E2 component (dihydrolipoyl transacylase)
MSVAFRLPDIGEGVAEAEVVRWLVAEGEEVEENQPVIEVQTDKAVVELPAPASGRVAQLCWKIGDVVPVGEVLYRLAGQEEEKHALRTQPEEPGGGEANKEGNFNAKKRKRVLAAPSTRRLARDLGVDLLQVKGTGVHGRVTDDDVRRAAKSRDLLSDGESGKTELLDVPPVSQEWVEESLTPTRRMIAERLLFSVTRKPHATHFDELPADGLVKWRNDRLRDNPAGPRLTYMAILAKLVAVALKHHPHLNAHFDEDEQKVRKFSSISLGIATDTPRGLLVPVLHQADRKNIEQIARELGQLTEWAREGKLLPKHLKGSTFTISNAGALGGSWATPIINPPEVAILAIHPIEQKPVVREGALTVGWQMNVSLSFDHRVLDGADAIRFTKTLGEYVSDPARLVKELV